MNNTSTSSVRATNKLIPELRFPEFLNTEEWGMENIASVCEVLNNKRKPISGSDREKGIYPYYGASGIVDYVNDYIFEERLLLIGEDGAKWGSYESTAFLVDGKFWVNNHAHVLKPVKVNDKLLEAYLVKLDIQPFVTGAAPPKLTLGKLKEIPVPVPKKPTEQKKIADCLSSLDEVITAHTNKLETLKTYKKGLMQNLFPQEGEKVPKLRFKEFEKNGEWIKNKLEKVAEIITGNTPSTSEAQYYNGVKLFVSPADINDYRYLTKTKTTLSELGFSKTRKIKENSVLFVCIGSTIGKIAQNKVECATNQQINSLTCYENYSNDFLYSNLEYHSSMIADMAGNHAVPLINKTAFSSITLDFPPTIQEQQKIADTLSSLDEVIKEQSNKIEQLKAHKKGLMQGLFPKVKN